MVQSQLRNLSGPRTGRMIIRVCNTGGQDKKQASWVPRAKRLIFFQMQGQNTKNLERSVFRFLSPAATQLNQLM